MTEAFAIGFIFHSQLTVFHPSFPGISKFGALRLLSRGGASPRDDSDPRIHTKIHEKEISHSNENEQWAMKQDKWQMCLAFPNQFSC